MLYYLLRIKDNSNIVPEYGAFDSMDDVSAFIASECSIFGEQIVWHGDGSVIYVRRCKYVK